MSGKLEVELVFTPIGDIYIAKHIIKLLLRTCSEGICVDRLTVETIRPALSKFAKSIIDLELNHICKSWNYNIVVGRVVICDGCRFKYQHTYVVNNLSINLN